MENGNKRYNSSRNVNNKVEQNRNRGKKTSLIANILKHPGKTVAATGLAVLTAFGLTRNEKETLVSKEKMQYVEEMEFNGTVIIKGGSNIRREPLASDNLEDGLQDTYLADAGDKTEYKVQYNGTVYTCDSPDDPNGAWYGFISEDFAPALEESGAISYVEMNKIIKHEDTNKHRYVDGVLWINGENMKLQEKNEAKQDTGLDK